ncbi:ABC transporter substrate-binding protein [Microbacterium sp. SYP-A9085]|uniref:ABC transporter substrate-binding protein n=1 Tax=Microbacterium sp. SYP-A9085 TaxID=2664454 RepID=UPI0015621AC6|nr:ABC transporter substrate-binding protein [Microbacterium sp. SYP-A9085]
MRVRLAATALVTAAALLLAGCSGAGPAPASSGDGKPVAGGDATFVISGRSWAHLDIAAPAVTPIKGLINTIYDGLLRMTPDGKIVPWLAKSYETSPDRLSWTFHLQEGVTFSDGTPFNAEAVKFNLERQVDPNQRAGEGGNLPQDITVQVVDEHTAVVKLSEPDEALPSALATTSVGLMASPTAVKKWGAEYGLHPVGAGPFMLDSQVVGQQIKLVKNPNYWVKGEPYLDSVTYRALGSADSALQTLKSGGADVMDFVAPQQANAVKDDAAFTLRKSPALSVNQLMLNTTKPPFDDVRARRAVGHAIDQQALSKSLFFGYFKPTESMIAEGSWASPGQTVDSYPSYDLDEAKKLVSEIGGLSFSVKVSNSTDFLQQAAAVQAMMAKAGIDMKIDAVEPSKKIADVFSHNYEAGWFVIPGLPDPDNYVRPFFDSTAGANPSGLHDAELDGLFAKGRTTAGADARKDIYRQVAQRMGEVAATVYVSDYPVMRLQNQRIHGIQYLVTDIFYLNGAWVSAK